MYCVGTCKKWLHRVVAVHYVAGLRGRTVTSYSMHELTDKSENDTRALEAVPLPVCGILLQEVAFATCLALLGGLAGLHFVELLLQGLD